MSSSAAQLGVSLDQAGAGVYIHSIIKNEITTYFAVHLPSGISRFLWGREMTAIECFPRETVRLLPVAVSILYTVTIYGSNKHTQKNYTQLF